MAPKTENKNPVADLECYACDSPGQNTHKVGMCTDDWLCWTKFNDTQKGTRSVHGVNARYVLLYIYARRDHFEEHFPELHALRKTCRPWWQVLGTPKNRAIEKAHKGTTSLWPNGYGKRAIFWYGCWRGHNPITSRVRWPAFNVWQNQNRWIPDSICSKHVGETDVKKQAW